MNTANTTNKMKQLILTFSLIAVCLTGCVTKTQQVSPAIPATPTTPAQPAVTNAVYVPSSALPVYQQQAHDAVNAVAPLATTVYPPSTVFVPVANTLIDSVFGIIATLSTALAAYKSQQASKQKAAAAALASAVITNPTAMATAVQNAASNRSTVLVQEHLTSANSPT